LDLALIKVDLEPPYVFSFTGRREFAPGDRIYAIGSPVGLDNTLTAGIVSAVGRRFLPLGEVIQVDAAVNPGNSGGPLLDAEGELAGVVFAGLPRYQGLNFAVPAHWAVRVLPDLYRGGEIRHPWLGIAAYEGREGLAAIYRHPDGSPAAPAEGELVRIAGRACVTLSEAQAVLLSYDTGTLVPVDFRAGGEVRRSWILLRPRPFSPGETAVRRDLRERLLAPFFGMAVTTTGKNSFVVERVLPGTIADEAGLSERDPLVIKDFVVSKENRALLMSLYVKKRKAGFLESIIQIAATLDLDSFL
jgi:S1-C subfamily serine protease